MPPASVVVLDICLGLETGFEITLLKSLSCLGIYHSVIWSCLTVKTQNLFQDRSRPGLDLGLALSWS